MSEEFNSIERKTEKQVYLRTKRGIEMRTTRISGIDSLTVPVTLLKSVLVLAAFISIEGIASAQFSGFPNPFKPKSNPSQVGRIDWPASYATGFRCQTSTFRQRADGVWVESRTNGQSSYFQEVRRSEVQILLFDHSRKMYVRLLENRAEWRSAQGTDWREWPGSSGSFIK